MSEAPAFVIRSVTNPRADLVSIAYVDMVGAVRHVCMFRSRATTDNVAGVIARELARPRPTIHYAP